MNESYDALLKYGVDVCSFKTDACVIVSSDLEQAGRALLRVAEGIQHEESQDSNRIRRTTNYRQKIKTEPLINYQLDVPNESDTNSRCRFVEP